MAIIWDIPYSRFIDKEKSVFIRNVHQLLHKGIKIQQSSIKFGLKINLINLSTITSFIYGMSTDSVSLLESYLSNNKQQIKINSILSSWSGIQKGVPQGSILGPLLLNVFINAIFYFVRKGTLYNYDNTLSYGHPDFNVLTSVLESESNVLINWFKVNKMQANQINSREENF